MPSSAFNGSEDSALQKLAVAGGPVGELCATRSVSRGGARRGVVWSFFALVKSDVSSETTTIAFVDACSCILSQAFDGREELILKKMSGEEIAVSTRPCSSTSQCGHDTLFVVE